MTRKKNRKYQIRDDRRLPLFKILFAFTLIVGLSIGYIWQRVTFLKISKEIKSLRSQISEQEERYKYLNIEIAKLSTVERIENIATTQLGLVYPKAEQIVFLKEVSVPSSDKKKGKLENLREKLTNFALNIFNISDSRLEAKETRYDL
jgi:cell division protein FtsL